jgi:quinohemoprotein ethanol dehydrogenase
MYAEKLTRWMMRAGMLTALLWVASTAIVGAATAGAPVDTKRIVNAAHEPQNWLTHGGSYLEQRYSLLDQINEQTVGQLALAWSADLDTSRGQEATPLVVDGVLYTTTAWSKVYAFDAATGRELWFYDPKVPGKRGVLACCDVVNRGAAFYDGKVFVATLDGRLIALDARTGHPLWSTITVDPTKSYTITGAPRVARGKVYIGNGGAEYGVRGYVSAYDEGTGKLLWRFYTVPGDPAQPDHAASDHAMNTIAKPTWFGSEYIKLGGGGTVWDSIVYDPELDQLYIGVGNGSPWNRVNRSAGKGDNLFLASIVALDPDTGKYLWHYQENPGESWDYTASQQITLATLPIDGKPRKVLLHAPKNGFFYVIDRTDGKLVSAEKFVNVNWADKIDRATGRPIEDPNSHYVDKPFLSSSGAAGAHNWFPMAFSPRTGLVYFPAQQIPFLYTRDAKFQYHPGQWNLGVDMMGPLLPTDEAGRTAMRESMKGWLVAWDPVAQKEAWRVPYDRPWNGGVLATAGNLVFEGTATGRFRAYSAVSGKQLWDFDAQTAIEAGPVSYSVGGVQYIAVLAGNGGGLPLTLPAFYGPLPRPPGRVLAFKLNGSAQLPPVDKTVAALTLTDESWSADSLERGRILYGANCAACHGMEALSAGVLPDLRRSAVLRSPEAFRQVVLGGALSDRGMVSFADRFGPDDAEAIRGYIETRARAAAVAMSAAR